ncbi:hypothetical protein DXG01_002643 [Tephrocybe rancida]|nr:hypothetical protein DXG01_002643 [Tephrocybe rancida]
MQGCMASNLVEAEFERSEQPYVPSLDDLNPHPFDTAVYSLELRNAVQILEGACAQLCATVARPSHTMLNKVMAFYEPACLHVVLSAKVSDILRNEPLGMHISEIEKISGIDQAKIGRILRLLASRHCFREVSRDVFANNRLSLLLLSDNPFYSLALDYAGENFKWTSELAETLSDPMMGHSNAPEHSAFNKYTKYSCSFFDYLSGAAPGGLEYGSRLGMAMVAWGVATEVGAIVNGFPWGELPNGATVCDVGGGVGALSIQLAKAYPKLRYKLQDTPERIRQAKEEVWPEKCPEAIAQNRIEFKAMDFFVESPIANCDVYYPACPPLEEESSHTPAPLPMLPNYGVGRIRQYNLDLDMMTGLNSQERTLRDFIRLGAAAGLTFVKLWSVGEMGIVELSPS